MLGRSLLTLFLVLCAGQVGAGENPPAPLRQVLNQLIPHQKPDSIEPAPIAGLYEVSYGSMVFYASQDGRYIIRGDLLDVEGNTNLTEAKRSQARVQLLKSIDIASAITFAPEHPKHFVTVFTDIDCPYCRKLHSHIADYNRAGIGIRYLAFPRSGVDTPSYYKAVSVWCAADRKAALTAAKAGKKVVSKTCDNPVDAHMALAAKFNVTGTPTLVLEDGSVIPGYIGPLQLAQLLDEREPTAKR